MQRSGRTRPQEDRRSDTGSVLVLSGELTQRHVLGISDYSVSLEKQEVLVTGTIGYDDLLAKIQKTGKEVRLLSSAEPVFIADSTTQVRSGETLI